ncbi:rhomboid family intramembrane serine protease [Rhizobium sp. BR 315]|uniref:rhomboid family intramembrane serine protease n=1 Tax=Rhizobium sp. BR 315 TaxID=3040014 RepID=UPI003D34A741
MSDGDGIVSESYTIDANVPRRVEFDYDRGRVLRLCFLAFVMAAAIACIPLLPERPGHPHLSAIFCWLGAAFFSVCGVLWLARAIRRTPGLVISADGIYVETHFDETIPWRSVRNISRHQNRWADQMYVDLEPLEARTLTRRGLMRWLPKKLRGRGTPIVVSLRPLRPNPDWIYNRSLEYLAKDREQQALPDGASNVTPQREDDVEPVVNLKTRPVFTYSLIVILIGIYVAELKFGVAPPKDNTPSIQTLLVLGGTFPVRVLQHGEWWRLVTAGLLHGSISHLLFNCFALWRAGVLLERLIGWRWFAALFCISAIGGSVASLLMNPQNLVGVGASGGIIGLFAAVIVASFHYSSGPLPSILRTGAIQILVPSLLPLVGQTADGMHVDYAAHLGGALAGGVVSLVLLKAWPNKQPHPRFGMAALIGTIVFATVAAGSVWRISELRAEYLADPFVQYFQGQYQMAADGFASKAKLNGSAAPYYKLWRFIAQSRGNDNRAAADLGDAANNVFPTSWPYPIYELFLGQRTPADVVAKATTNDKLCLAMFYIGEWYSLRKEVDEARQKFKGAILSCPTTLMEYQGAREELAKLAAP